jgi:hypothetical protein
LEIGEQKAQEEQFDSPCIALKELVDEAGMTRVVRMFILADTGIFPLNGYELKLYWTHTFKRDDELRFTIGGSEADLYAVTPQLREAIKEAGFSPAQATEEA